MICEVISSFLRIKAEAENFFTQFVKERNIIKELCEDLINDKLINFGSGR